MHVIVGAVVVVFVKSVVILLGVEMDESSFVVFVGLAFVEGNLLQDEKLLEKFLEVLFGDFGVDVAESAFVYVLFPEDILDTSSRLHYYVGLAQIVDQFLLGVDPLPDFVQQGVERGLYLVPLLPVAVDDYHVHLVL